ncbi:MAG: metalloregulator ArsR/SmtB family transcription factor, partial [Woeseiaceae bacterium]
MARINSAARDEQLDLVFRALGDRTRRKILSRLSTGSAMVTELAEPFDMSLPAVGKHLRVLENAGLVQRTINGRVHQCTLNASPMKDANEWLACYEQFWNET